MIECDLEIISPTKGKKLLSDYNVFTQDIVIQSIPKKFGFVKSETSHRRFFTGATDEPRAITVPFFTYDKYIHNFQLVRDELYGLFGDDIVYIRELRNGEYATGKQYRVYLTEVIEPSQQFKFSTGKLVFETAEVPYAISIKSSLEISNKGILAGDNWSHGMGLELVNGELPNYRIKMRSGDSFKILNPGNVDVDSFKEKFIISMAAKHKMDGRDSFAGQLRNFTNDTDLFFNYESSEESINLKYDGFRFFINNEKDKSAFGNNLELSPGINDIRFSQQGEINPSESTFGYIETLDVSFDFNFLYR